MSGWMRRWWMLLVVLAVFAALAVFPATGRDPDLCATGPGIQRVDPPGPECAPGGWAR